MTMATMATIGRADGRTTGLDRTTTILRLLPQQAREDIGIRGRELAGPLFADVRGRFSGPRDLRGHERNDLLERGERGAFRHHDEHRARQEDLAQLREERLGFSPRRRRYNHD